MKYVLPGALWMLLVAAPFAWCAGNDGAGIHQPAVRLRDAVEVKRDRVWLSDLLPLDAPSALQKSAGTIELCHAPQPGSTRTLDAGQIAIKLAAQPEVFSQLAIPPRITVRYSGWPITEEAVRMAISSFLRAQRWRRDLPDAARLEWARPLTATEEHPALQVMAFEWDHRQQSVQVRLRCSKRASCGSFLAHVFFPAPLDEEWRNRSASGSGLNSPSGEATAATGAVLAERGKPATLILDDGNMRISVRVICLQAGALNQQIRVFEAQGRHVFHAEVVGLGLLHASL
jgi:hypothetical protein